MPLFGRGDEPENRFKEAKRCSDPRKKEFDLDKAISLLKEAVTLRPDNEQYRKKLEEIRELKTKSSLKFSMRVRNSRLATFPSGEPGVVVDGTVEQGTIRNGDRVEIRGRDETRKARVFDVQSRKGFGVPNEGLILAIVTGHAVSNGDMIEGVDTETAG